LKSKIKTENPEVEKKLRNTESKQSTEIIAA